MIFLFSFLLLSYPFKAWAAKGSTGLLTLFRYGGIWMWILLVLSVMALTFIIEKFASFYISKINSKEFQNIHKALDSKDVALDGKDHKGCAFHILRQSLRSKTKEEFEKNFERAVSIQVNHLGRGLNLLATIGNVAPLLGFLGTVAGMITAFGNIAAADEVSARLVAGGIYTALTTTAFGLVIAIPSIALYNYFVHRIDNFVADMEKVADTILDKNLIKA
ncbi:MAG: MotA/TolQ/ExbB proton channel family protein [Spirochaetes bacterium]|nr:MotA/TolQ/ExbB proton channel family protein [Spirochaetota bacterium]